VDVHSEAMGHAERNGAEASADPVTGTRDLWRVRYDMHYHHQTTDVVPRSYWIKPPLSTMVCSLLRHPIRADCFSILL
jgi:hypothetical protein